MTRKYAKAPTYRLMWPQIAQWWDQCEIKPSRRSEFDGFVRRALEGKPRYQAVEKKSGVPWWMIAIIAERESGQRWDRSLAQGDPWNRRSTHEPKGRGPFKSWEDAALDALHIDHLDDVPEWRLEKCLFYMERFNGFGYWMYHNHMPSPYVWGATSVQRRGKYVADKKWDSSEWDTQLGCAGMIKALVEKDSSIKLPARED